MGLLTLLHGIGQATVSLNPEGPLTRIPNTNYKVTQTSLYPWENTVIHRPAWAFPAARLLLLARGHLPCFLNAPSPSHRGTVLDTGAYQREL